MADMDIIASLTTGGGMTAASVLIYFLKQIRAAIVDMDTNFKEMNRAMTGLNSTIVELITDRKRDKEEIDRIRSDLKNVWEKINGKA